MSASGTPHTCNGAHSFEPLWCMVGTCGAQLVVAFIEIEGMQLGRCVWGWLRTA